MKRIRVKNVFEEYEWLEKIYGKRNEDWKVLGQILATGNENGKKTYFDILKVELADKTIKEFEFELIDGIGEIKDKDRAKLLIFEDDPAILDIYKEVFSSNNFEVKTYDTYKDVVDVVIKENPDIIYCDIIMPDMNGWDAIKLLKKDERTKYIPVIIVDNQCGKKEVKNGYKAGAAFHCCKTEYTPKQLVDVFREFLSYKSKFKK